MASALRAVRAVRDPANPGRVSWAWTTRAVTFVGHWLVPRGTCNYGGALPARNEMANRPASERERERRRKMEGGALINATMEANYYFYTAGR